MEAASSRGWFSSSTPHPTYSAAVTFDACLCKGEVTLIIKCYQRFWPELPDRALQRQLWHEHHESYPSMKQLLGTSAARVKPAMAVASYEARPGSKS